jgi:hypothetical protein
MGQLVSVLFPPREPPDVVLVPPIFVPDGVRGRSTAAKPGYVTSMRPLHLKTLLGLYHAPAGVTGRLLLSPPGAEEVTVSACVVAAESSVSTARLALRWTPTSQASSFGELRIGGREGVALRAAVLHENSGLGAFAQASAAGTSSLLGVRYSGESLGLGVAALSREAMLAWAVCRVGRLTLGVEHRTPVTSSSVEPSPLLRVLRDNGLSCAVAFRPPPGAGPGAAFSTVAELTSSGVLVLSVWQHLAVCRRVYNALEDRKVKGIVNLLDVGLRFSTPLHSHQPPAFELGGAWQLNKNVLVKALLSSRMHSATLVLKSWWSPSVTAALSASMRAGEERKGVRYGFWLGMENVGVPRFESGAWEGTAIAATRRYAAPKAQLAAIARERPLVSELPPSAAAPSRL